MFRNRMKGSSRHYCISNCILPPTYHQKLDTKISQECLRWENVKIMTTPFKYNLDKNYFEVGQNNFQEMQLLIYKLYLMMCNIILGRFCPFCVLLCEITKILSFSVIHHNIVVQEYYQKNLKYFWSKWCMLKIVFRMCFLTFKMSIKFSDSKYILILMSFGSCIPKLFLLPKHELWTNEIRHKITKKVTFVDTKSFSSEFKEGWFVAFELDFFFLADLLLWFLKISFIWLKTIFHPPNDDKLQSNS